MAQFLDTSDVILEFRLPHDAKTRTVAERHDDDGENTKVSAVAPGGKLLRWIAVSFCILCVLQVALNVSFRLTLYAQLLSVTKDRDMKEKEVSLVSEEKDKLKMDLGNLSSEHQLILKERNRSRTVLEKLRWVLFRDSWYYVSVSQKTWEESRKHCLEHGADLMTINSKDEQDFANKFKKYMWIGMTDSEREGKWKWVDGTEVQTSYRTKNEPNGGTKENCGNIKLYSLENSWNDDNCTRSLNWICELKVD